MDEQPILSVVLPCLNEESGLKVCLPKIRTVLARLNIPAEIIIVDNGSTDKSAAIALEYGITLLREPVTGYGAACMKGFASARGKYIFLADPDGSYDFEEIPNFLKPLAAGWDFVVGNRFQGRIEKDAMPWSHRHLGNPLLSSILRLLFKTRIHDVHCGMRAISKTAYERISLMTTGMEFASEMIVMAIKNNLRVTELPINYHKRQGTSKLRKISDAWRHLRFMLLYKPFFLFFIPGLILFSVGTVAFLLLYFGMLRLFSIRFYYHPMFLASLLVFIGYQLMIFSLFAKTYAITHLGDEPILDKFYRYINIDVAAIIGLSLIVLGGLIYLSIL